MSDTMTEALWGKPKLRRTAVGQRYGRWTVVAIDVEHSTSDLLKWFCRCDCGTERSVFGTSLRSGRSESCGCQARERMSKRTRAKNLKHGRAGTAEYSSWRAMLRRCLDPRMRCYHNYGGRGITICAPWRHSFETFLCDMGPRPSPTHSLDRIDNDQGYSPENCRWATRREQLRNRRTNHRLTYQGQTKTLTEWAEELGLSIPTLVRRLKTMKLPVEEALGRPIDKSKSRRVAR